MNVDFCLKLEIILNSRFLPIPTTLFYRCNPVQCSNNELTNSYDQR